MYKTRATSVKLLLVRILAGLCVLMGFHSAVRAGVEPYENFIKGKLSVKDSILVKDEKFKNPAYNWSDISNSSVHNMISLKVLDEKLIQQNFSVEIELRVEYFSSPAQVAPTIIPSVKLKVNYVKDAGAVYQGTDLYSMPAGTNAYFVKVYIISINSPEYGSNPPDLQLSSSIVIDRQYLFKPAQAIDQQATMVSSGQLTNNQLRLAWPHIAGAEEYDVEWAIIDKGSEFEPTVLTMLSNSSAIPDAQLSELFRNNATRINTHENNYLLSLLYNSDYLVLRMRQVQYGTDSLRREGNWDYTLANNSFSAWNLTWHEQGKNWQYSATFAEEGKKKEQVSYFDGSLRNRQNVALNTSDNVAVVQETIYDEFGRQAASILPAPVKEGSNASPYLHYFTNLNRNNNDSAYNYSNLRSGRLSPQPLNNQYGTAKYYSPNNDFINSSLFNKYRMRRDILFRYNATHQIIQVELEYRVEWEWLFSQV
jgi:hypothetical protein